jgi:hypothetical protein
MYVCMHVCICTCVCVRVVISGLFFKNLLHNHFITEMFFKKKSGDVNDEANFSFFILLHKRANLCVRVCVCVCIYVCMCVCVCVYNTYAYIHACMH